MFIIQIFGENIIVDFLKMFVFTLPYMLSKITLFCHLVSLNMYFSTSISSFLLFITLIHDFLPFTQLL